MSKNWVRERAACTTAGFLRQLREAICEDVVEANMHFEPDKTFSLSCIDAPELRIICRLRGEDTDDSFILFKATGENAISVSLYFRNGNHRSLFSEKPMGQIDLDWDHSCGTCQITLCDDEISFEGLRKKTLGTLFFGD